MLAKLHRIVIPPRLSAAVGRKMFDTGAYLVGRAHILPLKSFYLRLRKPAV